MYVGMLECLSVGAEAVLPPLTPSIYIEWYAAGEFEGMHCLLALLALPCPKPNTDAGYYLYKVHI